MLLEALEGPDAVARALGAGHDALATLGEDLRARPPAAVLTVARGSSDHAAHFMAYLVMARLGRLVTSLPMSLITLYHAQLQCEGLLALAFSQSGQSPDLVAPMRHVQERGGRTVALVNDTASPLAQAARWVLPLAAGPETSVAATKSYLCQLALGAGLLAHWQRDAALLEALHRLPGPLTEAAAAGSAGWQPFVEALRDARQLYVIGRGTGQAIAMEAALKLKEVCGLHAEAFSGAELQHGPMALVNPGWPLLVLAPRGPAQAGLLALAERLRERGAQVLLAAPRGTPGAQLPLVETGHELLDPLAVVQSFYPAVEALARARGRDPDAPPHLAKVTRTH